MTPFPQSCLRLSLAIGLLLCTCVTSRAQQNKVFRAGAYAQDITPKKFPISVNGGMRDRTAKGAHDRLHARCLVLYDGKTRIAIVVCDSCMVPRDITDAAKKLAHKQTGIAPDHILISATHTHTAPTLSGVFQSDPDEAYRKQLVRQIAQGIAKAVSHLETAKIGWAIGKNDDQVYNRRWLMKPGVLNPDPFGKTTDKVRMNPGYRHPGLLKPAGPIDPSVSIVSVQSTKGRPIALLANYSLHYVGGVQPLSADYFGAFAERMAQLLKARDKKRPFVGIMSNGTSGDINNINYAAASPGRRQSYEQIRVVANSVAEVAFETYKTIQHKDWVSLDMAQADIELGVRLPNEKEIDRAKDILAKAKHDPTKRNQPVLKTREQIYARETVLISKYPTKKKVILQAVRIGNLGICAIPCEVFVEIGLELKKKSPLKPTFTIELANGYNGYLPTPRQHKLGGYETWRARSSYLEVGASPKITRTLLTLLKKVAKSK